ncbi:response regulator [Sinorhizobium medicae]|nr:response regulator [Sinorhizobium medicae]MDX1244545.1 response regulator [Sinorhizobium medicae]
MPNDTPDLMSPPAILIAASDDSLRSFLECKFKNKGVVIAGVSDGKALMEHLQQSVPNVLLIESRLSGIETQGLCLRLRLHCRARLITIIALAAEGDEASHQEILACSADQHLSRPISPETLITSISAICGSWGRALVLGSPERLTFLDVELDVTSYRVRRNGRTIHLPPTQFRLLCHLIRNPYKVYSRDELQNAAWPPTVHVGARTIDVHMGNLRTALNKSGGPDLIRTVRSVGYALAG